MTKIVDCRNIGQSVTRLGDYVLLTPEKLGGGTHATDLGAGRTLAGIAYWAYGDTSPISHHLAAYPSEDPRRGFDFVNTTQGGDNVMIYGLSTRIKERGILDRYGEGNHIYRVHYDGQQMNLLEDVAETTGLGLGVHTTIFPDATGFACADGQKDVCAFFNRAQADARTTVLMAFRTDWIGRDKSGSMDANWLAGGTLRLERLLPAGDTGRYDYQGSKGNKIEWEMAPMAEHLVYTAQLPGPAARTLAGLDAVVHHPGHRFSVLINRMTAAGIVVDRQSWEPICCLHSPEGAPNNLPIRKMASDPDIWEIEFEDVKCVAHEAGFSPDGRFYVSMNNIRQNNMAIYDSSAADPREWRVVAVVRDPAWVGEFPSPFHLCFSMDGSKMFVSVLYPKPRDSACYVVDTKSWQIICKFENIGPDCQTMAVTYDGKYVVQVFSGFQRLSSGLFIFTQDTLEPVGYLPNPGGPHDCVLVPPAVEHLRNSRCTTL